MSHYSDCYYEANKEQFEQERKAEEYRERMIKELHWNKIIKIMFTDFIENKSDYDVIKIAEKYL